MTARRAELIAEPWQADFLQLMRELERGSPKKPRIGKSAVLAQDIVTPGQDPFIEFPAANVTEIEEREGRPIRVRTRFLGYFGPQGALPLATTMEAYHWQRGNDASFVAFADIFATRFQQLFFRAWSDARPITQIDRPEKDRFRDYIGSIIGTGSGASRNRDRVPDVTKLSFAGLLAGRVKSAARLGQVLRGALGLDVEIVERVGDWLEFEPGDLSRLGQRGATLGQNAYLGARVYSVETRIMLKLKTRNLPEYESFLPGGRRFGELADMVRFYFGDMIDVDVQLALPRSALPAAMLGKSGRLGWTAWSAPVKPAKGAEDDYVADAVFSTARGNAPSAEVSAIS